MRAGDVLMFIDNIYRYTLAGTEVSGTAGSYAFSGRLPAYSGAGDGCASRANYVDQNWFYYIDPGGLCTGG